MNNLDKILAKKDPDETILEHTENAVTIWKHLKSRYKQILNFDDEFWNNSLLTVIFHDIGKITDNFQRAIKDKDYKESIRHELISGMSLLLLNSSYFFYNIEPLSAVFSHHKTFNDELFSNNITKKLKIDIECVEEFFDYFENTFKKILLINKRLTFEQIINYLTKNNNFKLTAICDDYFNQFFDSIHKRIKENSRVTYIFYKSLLQVSDWLSSGADKLSEGLSYDKSFLEKHIIEKLRQEGKTGEIENFSFKKFQKDSVKKSNILAIAPTGSGKTEAALLWASQKSNKFDRIMYLLPTRVTSNAIHKRLCLYFGDENAVIVHSSAFSEHKLEDDNYRYLDYLKDKTFFQNITVCTVDQILTMGFNLGYWELKTFNMLNSKVIIDEIHLYAPYTLGLIIATIKYLQENFNVSFYIMTATMPSKLKKLLLKTLQYPILIEDTELLDNSRNIFEIREKNVDELKDEIVEHLNNNEKVLLVVNTVNEAIRLYEEYEDVTPICYHSRFMVKDRKDKEQQIEDKEKNKEGVLLIATQVVEVCLDIDYDILFTENAPIDALIQRAGRVNRKRSKDNTKVIVFMHSSVSKEKIYDMEGVLDNTFGMIKENNGKKLTERELISLVDKVYENFDIEKDEHFKKGLNIYSEIQYNRKQIQDTSPYSENIYTREGLDTENVIPKQFKEDIENKKPYEKSQYEISIRKNLFQIFKSRKKIEQDEKDRIFKYIDAEYSYEKGLVLKNNNSYNDNGGCDFV